MVFAFLPVLLGMVARVTLPEIDDPNLVLPTLLREQLPAWLGALAMAAVFSTEVDTCDAILFMISTSASKDLYKRYLQACGERRRPASRRADRRRHRRNVRRCAFHLPDDRDRRADDLLFVSRRQPVRAGYRWPLHEACRIGGCDGRDRCRRWHAARRAVRIRQRISMAGSDVVWTACCRRCLSPR